MMNRDTVIVAAVATLIVITTAAVSLAAPENAFAYKKNQAASQTSGCGNGEIPTNVGCQNTDSQIQGDENAVVLTAQQTFPEAPEPSTCEECFTTFLTPEQIVALENAGFIGIQQACFLLSTATPEELESQLLGFEEFMVENGINPATAQALVDCLERVLGPLS